MNRDNQRKKRNRVNESIRKYRLTVLATATLVLASIIIYLFSIMDEKIYYLRYHLTSSLVFCLFNLGNILRPRRILIDLSSSFLYVSHLMAVQLTVWDWQSITGTCGYWMKTNSYLNGFFITSSVLSFFYAADWFQTLGDLSVHISLVLGVQSLMWICGSLELNWTSGFIVLVIMNHVTLPMVARRYSVSQEEFLTVAKSFTVVFTYYILQDAASNAVGHNAVGNNATSVADYILAKRQ